MTFSMSEVNKNVRIAMEAEEEQPEVDEKSQKEIEEEKKNEKEKQQKRDDLALVVCMLVLIGLTVFVVLLKVRKTTLYILSPNHAVYIQRSRRRHLSCNISFLTDPV